MITLSWFFYFNIHAEFCRTSLRKYPSDFREYINHSYGYGFKFIDQDLSPETTYSYKVASVNSQGETLSEAIEITTSKKFQEPWLGQILMNQPDVRSFTSGSLRNLEEYNFDDFIFFNLYHFTFDHNNDMLFFQDSCLWKADFRTRKVDRLVSFDTFQNLFSDLAIDINRIDARNLHFNTSNSKIYFVMSKADAILELADFDTSNPSLSIIAGKNILTSVIEDGIGGDASFNILYGMDLDASGQNIYIIDFNTVRQVNIASREVTTVFGDKDSASVSFDLFKDENNIPQNAFPFPYGGINIHVASDDSIYLLSYKTISRVLLRISPDRQSSELALPFMSIDSKEKRNGPADEVNTMISDVINVDPGKEILLYDSFDNVIKRYDLETNTITQLNGYGPTQLLSDQKELLEEPANKIPLSPQTRKILMDNSGNIFSSEYGYATGVLRLVGGSFLKGSLLRVIYPHDADKYFNDDGSGGQPVNESPVAVDDFVDAAQGLEMQIAPLLNDSDPDGDELTISSFIYNGSNSLTLNPDNKTFTYLPSGTNDDIFAYEVSDGNGNSSLGIVRVTIQANNSPVALDDSVTLVSGDQIQIAPLLNDSDTDGDELTISSFIYNGLNSLTLNPDNKTFTYSSLIAGNDIFTYTVSDGKGGTATAEVSISIQQAGSNPSVRLDDRSPDVPELSPVDTLLGTFIIEDADLPNDTHTLVLEERSYDLGPDGTPISSYFKIENNQLLVAKTLPRLNEARRSIHLRYEVEDSTGNKASNYAFVKLIDDDQDDEFDINEASSLFNVDIDKDLINSGTIGSVSELYTYTQEGEDLNTIPEAISFEGLTTNFFTKKDLSIFKVVSKKDATDPGSPAYENFDFKIVTRISESLLSELKDIVFYDLNPQYNFEVNSVGYTYNSLVKHNAGQVSSVSSISSAYSRSRFASEPTYINQTASEIEIDFPYEDKIPLNNSETADIAEGRFKIKFDRATLKDEFTRAHIERGGSQGAPKDILLLDGNSIVENNQSGDLISRLYAPEDKDIFDLISFELVPSENSSKFSIDGNLLLANTIFDFEFYTEDDASEIITVKATDSVGNEYIKELTIQILDTEEPVFEPTRIGETGSMEFPRLGSSKTGMNIKTVYFKGSYENPVVILNHNSNSDSQPAIAVVKNLRENAFDLELQEWLYQNGVRSYNGSNPAVIEYMVFEAGQYELDDGTKIEAGFVNAGNDFSTHNFNTAFTIAPTIFTQVISGSSSQKPVVERLRHDISNTAFSILIEAEEADSLTSQTNQIGYVAIEDSSNSFFNFGTLQLNHTPKKVVITENEIFISRMQSYKGSDTSNLRAYRSGRSSIDVFVQEEQSLDSEMKHTNEEVAYTKLPRNHVIKIQSDTNDQTYLSSEAATTNIAVQLANDFNVYIIDPLKGFVTGNFNLNLLSGSEFASITPDKKIELNASSLKNSNLSGDLISYEIEDISNASKAQAKLTIATQAEGLSDIAEIGSVELVQNSKDAWTTVNLSKTFVDPVVIMSPVTFRGPDPSTLRVRNINSNSFEFQVDEWDYKDGAHTRETVNYLVIEKGIHELKDGSVFEAGDLLVSHEATIQVLNYPNYNLAINADPIILTQVSSVNEASAVVTRLYNISEQSFKVLLSEEEANDGIHAAETVGYLAIYKNPLWSAADSNVRFGNTGVVVNHNLFDINYNALNSKPKCFAQIQTYVGPDPSALRFKNTTQTSLTLFVEEEQSLDNETGHIYEDIGYYCSSEDGLVQANSF